MGTKVNRLRVIPRSILEHRASGRTGVWSRLARSIMRRPILYLVVAGGLMIGLALPALGLHLTSGDNRGVPLTTESTRGFALLRATLGPGALAPNQIVIDTGRRDGAYAPDDRRREPASSPSCGATPRSSRRRSSRPRCCRRARAAGRSPSATASSTGPGRSPRSASPARGTPGPSPPRPWSTASATPTSPTRGSPAAPTSSSPARRPSASTSSTRPTGRSRGSSLAVLVLSYLLLLRAFRSVVLPLKAVLINLLSVSATYGVLVLVFQHGLHSTLGLKGTPQIEAWIPIFLFAMLFGLSMDYEVFLLSRMREEWDKPPRQRGRGRLRPRAHRPHHHRRGADHDRRLLRLHRRLVRRPAGVRRRPLGGDPARRDDRPRAARARR